MEVTFNTKTTIQLQPNKEKSNNRTKHLGITCFNFSVAGQPSVNGRINERQIKELMTGPFPTTLCLATEARASIQATFEVQPNFDLSKLDRQAADQLRELFPEAEKGYSKAILLGGALAGLLLIGGMAAWLYQSK